MGLVLANIDKIFSQVNCDHYHRELLSNFLKKNHTGDELQGLQKVIEEPKQCTECDDQEVENPITPPAPSVDSDCSPQELSTLALLKVLRCIPSHLCTCAEFRV